MKFGWEIIPLGKLCEVEGGNAAPQGNHNFERGTVPFVRMKDLGRYHFTDNLNVTDDLLTDTAVSQFRMKIFDPGCILFPRSGSVALNHRAILGVHACVVSHIGVLRDFKPKINSRFLYRFLQTYDMTNLSKKTTGVDSIAFSDVKMIPITVPPLHEQDRIASILDAAEELLRLREQADRRTSDLIPALFHEMFGDSATNLKRWPLATLGDLGDIGTGTTPSRENPENYGGTIPWVKTTEVRGVQIAETEERLTEQGIKNGRCKIFPKGSIVIAMYGQGKTMGRTAVLGIDACTNQACAVLKPDVKYRTEYVLTYLQMSYDALRLLGRGGNQPNLNLDLVRKFTIPNPPVLLQEQFVKKVSEMQILGSKQAHSRCRLGDLFQSLHHRAFRGEL